MGNRQPAPTDMALARAVFEVSVTRFAWTARAELGPDVVMDPGNEDALVEAVARFLWAHRHDGLPTVGEDIDR